MSQVIVHTLGYNIPELIEEATVSLYKLNPENTYKHVIADLGYPLGQKRESWEMVPQHMGINKRKNAVEIVDIGTLHMSDFVRVPNKGVSGNWTQIAQMYDIGRGDVLIGADPDERPMDKGWVDAMAKVMQGDSSIAIVSLVLPELLALEGFFEKYFWGEREVNGIRVWEGKSMCQWALIGISGNFISAVGGIPHPDAAPLYGWIETACDIHMKRLGMKWVILPDYRVQHIASSPLAQEWKNWMVGPGLDSGQVPFEQWLRETKGAKG
jgi:hypothetical protein